MVIEKNKLLRGFLIKALFFYLGWLVVFHGYIKPTGYINNYLTLAVAKGTMYCAQLLSINPHMDVSSKADSPNDVVVLVYFDQEPAVFIANGCNGLSLFALFIGFLICFPGYVVSKMLFSVAGTIGLFLINVLRELLLAFNFLYFRSSVEFNHKYTYAIVVYVVVFLLWRYWLNSYSILSRTRKA